MAQHISIGYREFPENDRETILAVDEDIGRVASLIDPIQRIFEQRLITPNVGDVITIYVIDDDHNSEITVFVTQVQPLDIINIDHEPDIDRDVIPFLVPSQMGPDHWDDLDVGTDMFYVDGIIGGPVTLDDLYTSDGVTPSTVLPVRLDDEVYYYVFPSGIGADDLVNDINNNRMIGRPPTVYDIIGWSFDPDTVGPLPRNRVIVVDYFIGN